MGSTTGGQPPVPLKLASRLVSGPEVCIRCGSRILDFAAWPWIQLESSVGVVNVQSIHPGCLRIALRERELAGRPWNTSAS